MDEQTKRMGISLIRLNENGEGEEGGVMVDEIFGPVLTIIPVDVSLMPSHFSCENTQANEVNRALKRLSRTLTPVPNLSLCMSAPANDPSSRIVSFLEHYRLSVALGIDSRCFISHY